MSHGHMPDGMPHGLGNGWKDIFNSMGNITDPGSEFFVGKNSYVQPFEKHLNIEYANYIGSETSPPCRHGVKWIVSYCPHGLVVTSEQVNHISS